MCANLFASFSSLLFSIDLLALVADSLGTHIWTFFILASVLCCGCLVGCRPMTVNWFYVVPFCFSLSPTLFVAIDDRLYMLFTLYWCFLTHTQTIFHFSYYFKLLLSRCRDVNQIIITATAIDSRFLFVFYFSLAFPLVKWCTIYFTALSLFTHQSTEKKMFLKILFYMFCFFTLFSKIIIFSITVEKRCLLKECVCVVCLFAVFYFIFSICF